MRNGAAGGRKRRSEKQWREIFRKFESSGLSVTAFCRRERLPLGSFQRWRQRLGSSRAAEFVELVADSSMTPPPSWSLEVALPNGVTLSFRG